MDEVQQHVELLIFVLPRRLGLGLLHRKEVLGGLAETFEGLHGMGGSAEELIFGLFVESHRFFLDLVQGVLLRRCRLDGRRVFSFGFFVGLDDVGLEGTLLLLQD